ncbi:hypothetical protein ACLB2K_011674 [Fragaria x ananassa]
MSLCSPLDGSDDGAPPPERTPAVSPITFSFRRDRYEGLVNNLHPKLQTLSISPENWNSADSPGRESDQGRLWCPLGWRRAVVRARWWRTEGRPHFKGVQTFASDPDYSIKPWWEWAFWISPLSYAQRAVSVNEFTAVRWLKVCLSQFLNQRIKMLVSSLHFPSGDSDSDSGDSLDGDILIDDDDDFEV